MDMDVIHDQNRKEFRIDLNPSTPSDKAYLTYALQGNTIDFQHTFVPSKYRGQGIAEKLVQKAMNFVEDTKSIEHILPSCSYVAKYLSKTPQYARYLMTTIRLKLPANLYRPWKPLYRQRSKKPKDPPPPYTPLEQQLYDQAKVKFDQRMNILRALFAQERQSLSTKSRFAELQLKAEEKEFRQLIQMVQNENERLLNLRREDEKKALEEEEQIRSNVLNLLSEREFSKQVNIEEEVKMIKAESRSWIDPKNLTKEIERMLNEKHDYNFSIDLQGTKRNEHGKEILQENQSKLVTLAPFESEPKTVQRKPPGASKYEE